MGLKALLVACLMAGVLAASVPSDWAPRIKGGNMIYSPTDQGVQSTLMPIVANGYLGTVVSTAIMYVSGVYNGGNTSALNGPSHRAIIPSTVGILITNANIYATAIDLEVGIYYRRSTLNSNANVQIEQRWFAHRDVSHLLVHEIEVINPTNAPVSLSLSLNQTTSPDIAFTSIFPSNETVTMNGSTLIPELPNGPLTQVTVWATKVPSTLLFVQGTTVFQFLTVITTSLESSDPIVAAKSIYNQFYNTSLEPSHTAAWQLYWESGIEIEGDPYLAAAVNNSLYEILSNIRVDWPYSLSPGGISTNGYNGHTFWDSETWMYPTILLLYPELAHEMLAYRYARIPNSEQNARAMGYSGVKYSWESAFTGIETTFFPPNTEGHLEIHINGDVARAVAQYFWVTQDLIWLNSTGLPILYGIAEYWASRVEKNTTSGEYVINGVQCPDEHAVNVNNSIFTNVVAGLSLTYAYQFGKLLGLSPPYAWMDIAQNIKIPFDEAQQMHPEYDGYTNETINQADVALLQYPLGYSMPTTVAVNDLLYYQNHTDRNGMFTGDCSYSIAWLRLGNPTNAEYYFNNTLEHLKLPYLVFTERIVGGIPHFITGAGGFLQNIVFGYVGLQLEEDAIVVYPSFLPPGSTTQVTIRKFEYLGNLLSITVNATHISFVNNGVASSAARVLYNSNTKPTQTSLLYITNEQGNTQQLTTSLVYSITKLYLHA